MLCAGFVVCVFVYYPHLHKEQRMDAFLKLEK